MRFLSFGSLNLDFVYQVDHIVMPGETLASQEEHVYCGGKGLNQSIALARAGASVFHAGRIGADGRMLVEQLEKDGVDCRHVLVDEERTGCAMIQVAKNGQNSILLYAGANFRNTEEQADAVLEHFSAGDAVILQNEINQIGYISRKAHEKGMTVIFNPSPFNDRARECDLMVTDHLVVNEIEGAQIAGCEKPDEILGFFRREYPHLKVLLTLGSRGAVYWDGRRTWPQKACPVNAVDTTAAGDTFTGFFYRILLVEENPSRALEIAAKASAIAVSRPGASPSIPYLKEVLNPEE